MSATTEAVCRAPAEGVARYSKAYAANFASATLYDVDGYPDHAAQLVEFFNAGTSVEYAVYVTIDGNSHTTPLAPLERWAPASPVSSISQTSSANVSAEAFWWPAEGHAIVES